LLVNAINKNDVQLFEQYTIPDKGRINWRPDSGCNGAGNADDNDGECCVWYNPMCWFCCCCTQFCSCCEGWCPEDTLLHYALRKRAHQDIILKLLVHGANVNTYNWAHFPCAAFCSLRYTPKQYAMKFSDKETKRVLMLDAKDLEDIMIKKRKPLQIVRQGTVETQVIEKMVIPAAIEMEKQRQKLIKKGGENICFMCNGTGKMGQLPKEAQELAAAGLLKTSTSKEVKEEKKDEPKEEVKEEKKEEEEEEEMDPLMPVPSRLTSVKEDEVMKYVKESKDSKELKCHKVAKWACVVCEGKGTINKNFKIFDAKESDAKLNCAICWDPGQYGLSTECDHFFCVECIEAHIQSVLDRGKFPAYCPACEVSFGVGKVPPVGAIKPKALNFLAQRGVITREQQLRFMLQQDSQNRRFFRCPGNCGRLLQEVKNICWQQRGNLLYAAPGQCECGTLVCVVCHKKMDRPNEVLGKHAKCYVDNTFAGQDFDDEGLMMMHKQKIKMCPKCGMLIQKNEGCNMMMCGGNADGSVGLAKKRGCGYRGQWKTFYALAKKNQIFCKKVLSVSVGTLTDHFKWDVKEPGNKKGAYAEIELQVKNGSIESKSDTAVISSIFAGHPTNTYATNFVSFTLKYSTDGKNWEEVDGGRQFEIMGREREFELKRKINARFIRIDVHKWIGQMKRDIETPKSFVFRFHVYEVNKEARKKRNAVMSKLKNNKKKRKKGKAKSEKKG